MKHEIIGETMEVIDARNKDLIGLKGKVIDETRNTIAIAVNDYKKKILKQGTTLRIGGKVVEGDTLVARPEDRVKK